MKILLSLCLLALVVIGYVIWRGFYNARHNSPEKDFYDLWWKIEYALINHINEKYITNEIARLRKMKRINQSMLDKLEDKFKCKFELDCDELTPDNVF